MRLDETRLSGLPLVQVESFQACYMSPEEVGRQLARWGLSEAYRHAYVAHSDLSVESAQVGGWVRGRVGGLVGGWVAKFERNWPAWRGPHVHAGPRMMLCGAACLTPAGQGSRRPWRAGPLDSQLVQNPSRPPLPSRPPAHPTACPPC